MSIKGRDLVNGVPKEIEITESEVSESLQEPVTAVVETVRSALENTPPELSADIVDKGIVMTGGGSLLLRLDELLRIKPACRSLSLRMRCLASRLEPEKH